MLDYDYIVIAIMDYNISSIVKRELIQKGIPCEKILLISSKTILSADYSRLLV